MDVLPSKPCYSEQSVKMAFGGALVRSFVQGSDPDVWERSWSPTWFVEDELDGLMNDSSVCELHGEAATQDAQPHGREPKRSLPLAASWGDHNDTPNNTPNDTFTPNEAPHAPDSTEADILWQQLDISGVQYTRRLLGFDAASDAGGMAGPEPISRGTFALGGSTRLTTSVTRATPATCRTSSKPTTTGASTTALGLDNGPSTDVDRLWQTHDTATSHYSQRLPAFDFALADCEVAPPQPITQATLAVCCETADCGAPAAASEVSDASGPHEADQASPHDAAAAHPTLGTVALTVAVAVAVAAGVSIPDALKHELAAAARLDRADDKRLEAEDMWHAATMKYGMSSLCRHALMA